GQSLDRADEVVAVTRLVGDQLQEHQPKLTRFEHSAAAPAVAAAAFRTVADIEMKRSPMTAPTAPAAHCKEALRNVDFEMTPRTATMMTMSHILSFDVS